MRKHTQRGMTLVELMVGLVIGLLTVLAVMQVLSVAEGMRRNTTSGADAQINGALAMNMLLSDIRQAGYGLADNPMALGCKTVAQFKDTAVQNWTLAPVVINDAASGAPAYTDSLTVFSSGKSGASVPLAVKGDHAKADTLFTTSSFLSVANGDLMVAVPTGWDNTSSWCSLFAVTADPIYNSSSDPSATLTHDATTNDWNKNQATNFPAKYLGLSSKTVNSYLLNLGNAPVRRTYAIASNVLQITDLNFATGASVATDAFPEIVNMQALYGKDTNADGVVDTYDTTTPTTNAGWRQVLAIRVALVARSSQYEKNKNPVTGAVTPVTSSQPEWNIGSGVTATGSTACTSVTGSKCFTLQINHLADWQQYRYKVYDVVIPLRNVLWNS